MKRTCLDCGAIFSGSGSRCPQHDRAWQARRNARPERAIYRNGWSSESRRIRAEQPWCSNCGREDDLTVDHGSGGMVLCRSCHARVENGRRRSQRLGGVA